MATGRAKRHFHHFLTSTISATLTLATMLCAGLLSTPSFAKSFKTEFIHFELPPNWSCKQEELDWTCQPDNLAERSEAIIIVVVKSANETDDTLPKYKEVLKTPRAMRDLLGNAYQSQVKFVNDRTIKGHPWVDGLLLGSEIPGFYTRVVVSTKDKVAGMLAYSVAESVYAKYATMMDSMLETLEIYFDPKAYNDLMKSSGPGLFKPRVSNKMTAAGPQSDVKKAPAEDKSMFMLGSVLLVGIAVYLVWKMKKRNG